MMTRIELTGYILFSLLTLAVSVSMPIDGMLRVVLVVFGLLAFKHALTDG